EPAEVSERDRLLPEPPGERPELRVRACEEHVEEPELVHDPQRGRVDRVAAEVAEEVPVLLEHDGTDTRPREQIPEHHPGRAPADDARLGVRAASIARVEAGLQGVAVALHLRPALTASRCRRSSRPPVTRAFDSTTAVDGLDLTIDRGEVFG